MPTVKAIFTADISQFRQSLAQATTAVTAFDRTTTQVSNDLKRFANEFSGAKVQREAETMARAIRDIGGAFKLTADEQRKAATTIDAALAKYKALGTEAPASLRTLSAELKTLHVESTNVASSVGGIGDAIKQGLGIGAGIGAFGLITQGVAALKSAIVDTVVEGNKLSQLRTAFTNLQGGPAQASVAIEGLRVATRGLVSDVDLLAAANKASLLGLGQMGIKTNELASIAVKLGKAMGQDAAKSVDDLTTALARQSPQILDNLGIKVDLTSANEKYAASLGKTVAALTDEEKKIAFATAAMDAARAKSDTLGESQLTLSEQIARVGNSLTNTQAGFGAMINESTILSGAVGSVAGRLDELATNVGRLGPAFTTALGPIGQFIARFAQVPAVSKDIADGFALIVAPALGAVNLAVQGVTRTLERYAQVRQFVFGADSASTGPKRTADIQLQGGTSKQAQEQARHAADAAKAQEDAMRRIAAASTTAAASTRRAMASITKDYIDLTAGQKIAMQAIRDSGVGWEEYAGNVQLARMELEQFIDAQHLTPLQGATHPFSSLMRPIGSLTGIAKTPITEITKATKDWRVELQGVAQAFAQLAQVGGRSLDGLSRTIGGVFASANAGLEMVRSLSGILGGLTNKDGELTNGGKALGGGIAGLGTGLQAGSLFTNRGAGFAAGAAGGALSGGMAAGWIGAGVGALVGGFAGMFAAAANAAARRVAKDVQAGQLTAEFGGLDNLLDVVGRLGLNQQTFLERYFGEPEDFALALTELNSALASERIEVDKLSKSLTAASKAQGILSIADMARLRNLRSGGPGDEMRQQFLQDQSSQLVQGLTSVLQNGQLSPESVGSIGVALGSAFGLMRQQGMSVKQVLEALAPAMDAFQQRAVEAGLGSTEQFDNLKRMLDTLRGPLGNIIDGALGAGQALAALTNTGMINQDMFGGLSKAVSDAFFALERDGKGGRDAVLLLQGPLQNIWQLVEDFGLEVDDATRSLLDFAQQEGLIGDQFRPATDRMIEALDKLIDRMDQFLQLMAQVNGIEWPTPNAPPAPEVPGSITFPEDPNRGDPGRVLPPGVVPMPGGKTPVPAVEAQGIDLNSLRASSVRDGAVVTIIELDGEVLARANTRNTPGVRRLMGAA